ncbi:MAG: phenylacetate-CoA oxygenase subunit PaaJ [Aestuariivita sp.]|nr:phenylacetate-CoA oxygenase subunit PaaJ [Aestuariivita sp.]MCY4288754.1 phenylacetate-CoA oxygenase subunit PaaJ [Aestuariivita sp.]MCY4346695.1 phenylacetate-CoA oxygenase subunit PaaJ [Aestuariivita sp.]
MVNPSINHEPQPSQPVGDLASSAASTAQPRPTIDQIYKWLASVMDPEIPVLSVIDLGIIREVNWNGDALEIAITPTYTGCPATTAITEDIEMMLRRRGITEIAVNRHLAPAWSSDWITSTGRAKLEAYGIAPPQLAGHPERCPRCHSNNLFRVSEFGSTPCKALWRCQSCLEAFDYFKCL